MRLAIMDGNRRDEPGILSFLPPSTDDVIALSELRDQGGNVGRVVLKVTV